MNTIACTKNSHAASNAGYYSNQEIRAIILSAPREHRGALILGSYGMILPKYLSELSPECVDLEKRQIVIPATFNLDRHCLVVRFDRFAGRDDDTCYPLWELLAAFPFQPLPVSWGEYRRRLGRPVKQWIADGLRRTGVANYIANYGLAEARFGLPHCHVRSGIYFKVPTCASAREFFQLTASDFEDHSADV